MRKRARKRKNLSGEERKEAIIEAAVELFSRHGFCGTSMRKLARLAGVTEAVIYMHFPSKEALFDAILEKRIYESRRSLFPAPLADAKQDRALLETIVGNYLKRESENNSFMRILLFSALEEHQLIEKYVNGPMQEFFDFFGSYLRERVRDGAMQSMNEELTSRLIMGMAFTFALLRDVFKDPKVQDLSLEDVTKTIVDIYLNGVAGSGGLSSSAA